eukprot:g7609.t1
MEQLQILSEEEPPSAEAYEIAQRRISELELENEILREQVKKYELQFATTASAPNESITHLKSTPSTDSSSKENLIKSVSIDELRELREKSGMQAKESASRMQAMLENCKKMLAEATVEMEAEPVSNDDDAASITSRLNTQESESTPDDASEI